MINNKPIWVAGLMSGTSIDGVDVACLETDGDEILSFGDSAYVPYSSEQQEVLRGALGKWPNDPGLKEVESLLIETHCLALKQVSQTDLVGFHGQTLAHDPDGGRTHQIGNGVELARCIKKAVVWDFRSRDVASGGQGAPLAPVFHRALVNFAKIFEPVVIINLGGVGNLTWIDPVKPPEKGLIAFDTGPANAPLNDYMMRNLGKSYDKDGILASSGTVETKIVEKFLSSPYFSKMPPKSLDRNDFIQLQKMVADLSLSDAAATLTAIIVASVCAAFELLPSLPSQVWITGGGRKNQVLMRQLKENIPTKVFDIDIIGFDGDMLEAQAFAFLAARSMRNLPISYPKTTGVQVPMHGGTVSFPQN